MAKRGYISPDGTARKTAKIYLGDENGLSRKITKAYIGDENGIAREWFVSESPIGNLPIGASVFMNVNGVRTEFLVVHQGIPDSTLYDASCNGTWLLMKDIYTRVVWDKTNNDYANSDVHAYLNNTFIGLLDQYVQSNIKQIKIPYVGSTGRSGSVKSGSNGLSTKIFLPSAKETNYSNAEFNDGVCLSYFMGTSSTDDKFIAYYNGSAENWSLRTPCKGSDKNVRFMYYMGYHNSSSCIYDLGVRPALILPSNTLVDEEFNVIGQGVTP